MTSIATHTGRYAPSPTGDLHLGNIRTALLAWLHTRLSSGQFLLRMEDLDLPRVVDGSAVQIIRDLEWLGLDWDGEIVYQSTRNDLYRDALGALTEQGLVYPCFCSRKDIQQAASAPHVNGTVYPGTCRDLSEQESEAKRRDKTPAIRICVADSVRADNTDCTAGGDFVVKRADSLFAYQLAVVVDDLEQGVTDVVRGSDLLESTPRQCFLAGRLSPNANPINYYHAPLMLDNQGRRLSKRDGSLSVSECRSHGQSAAQVIGELAFGLQLIDKQAAISPRELLNEVSSNDLQALFS